MSDLRAGDRLGRYVIERELGRGGMGAVFLARDEHVQRRVALKVIVSSLAADPEFRARFEREARIAATLEHPHVVPVYDVGEADGRLFIAMRFVDGTDLANELLHAARLPPERLARILADVCAALDGAHRAGLVHRSVVRISEDEGRTWTERPIPGSRGRVHPSVVELGDGELVAFFRSRAADRVYASRSADNGRTWSEPERTPLPNNSASIQATCLRSGRIAMVFNHFSANDDPDVATWPTRRYPLTIALSEDGGRTWPHMRHIDPGDGFFGAENEPLNRVCAYPALVQGPDDAIHVAYSYRGRQCIKYVRVTEDWIRDEVDWVDRAHVSHAHPF